MTDVFGALADPSRRRLLEQLAGREASVTELSRALPVTRQAVAKHMAALASAGLVDSRRVGRERLYRLNPEPLDGAAGWIARVGSEWEGGWVGCASIWARARWRSRSLRSMPSPMRRRSR